MSHSASLQMYWTPSLASAVETWWQGLRRHFISAGINDVPENLLTPDDILSVWHRDDLLFSQTCGGPLIRELGDTVRVVGTPVYDTPLTKGINYRSAIIVHRDAKMLLIDELAGSRVAINGRESYSGYLALKAALADIAEPGTSFFGEVIVSGAHHESLRMVAAGEADCAAIDAVSFALGNPEHLDAVRVIEATRAVPGLPYITGRQTSDSTLSALRQAVRAAMGDPDLADARKVLLLKGFEPTTVEDYAPITEMIERGRNIDL